VAAVKQSLAAADIYVQQKQADPNAASLVSATIGREGEAAEILASVGALDPSKAEHYFQEGVSLDATFGYRAGSYNAYRYAAFLAVQNGTSQSSAIATLLAPFKVGNDAAIAITVPQFFQSARTNPALASDKASLIRLAALDPSFKSYLLSIGWQASDFSSRGA
jgi:hypothetical protein